MSLCCQHDERRDAVRSLSGWNGLDYAEVSDDQLTITLYFLGKLPPELSQKKPGLEQYLQLEGGQRITDIQITHVEPQPNDDPERDDRLVVTVDKYGDFSTYSLRLVNVANIDPRYDHVDFSFKVNCPSDLDCAAPCTCAEEPADEPEINYLAKDYGSFRQLILDRLALLMPGWQERHVPDIGIALVEVLAYAGDYLSYYQDAVSTEAYLGTARQRISVRRHTRLVDYILHEGCNARAFVVVETGGVLELDAAGVSFITGLNDTLPVRQAVLTWEDLLGVPETDYEVFEPMVDAESKIRAIPAHNEIRFHTWGEHECCLGKGSTSATFADAWEGEQRALALQPGDVLVFEEVRGPGTGLVEDADPAHRCAVRLTKVTAGEDPVILTNGQPTPYVTAEWSTEDALPFPLCISTIGPAPECHYLENITVARGNVILVDHGKKQPPEDLGTVPTLRTDGSCECEEEPGDVQTVAGKFCAQLKYTPVTYRGALPARDAAATTMLTQDPRAALPQVWLTSNPARPWQVQYDLIASDPSNADYVVEIDNDGIAHLRFGDGQLGYAPAAGMKFQATYRVGNGAAGNVGAEAISRIVLKDKLDTGFPISVRNPLPASGGTEGEPIAEAKLYAPHVFRKTLDRAVIAQDYADLAARNGAVQRAAADLVWTGSWYEADVAIDPLGTETTSPALLGSVTAQLECYRRMGQDLAVLPAEYVPIDLSLIVCALPDYQRGHVKAALLDAFSNRRLADGTLGFFHPDNLTFGGGIYLSQIVARAQGVAGVECVRVKRFQRLFEPPNREIEDGILPLKTNEIAQLDNDPNYPEYGELEILVEGGR